MKVISFHNEKGGVGKSFFNILYASWLKYQHNIKVALVDFNGRVKTYRMDEIKSKKALGIWNDSMLADPWPIITGASKENAKNYKGILTPNATWFENEVRNGTLKDIDVVIIDFPGANSGREFLEMILSNSMSLVPVILDRDIMTIRAATKVLNTIHTYAKSTVTLTFINQIQSYLSMSNYEFVKDWIMDIQERFLPDGVSYSERVRNLSSKNNIRCTLNYPDWNDKEFEGSKDLGTENLFIDITRELNKAPDYKDTSKTDLSFADSMTKTFHERRQFFNTSFPEYEFDISMFPESRKKIE